MKRSTSHCCGIFLLLVFGAMMQACTGGDLETRSSSAVKVEIVNVGGRFQILRDGEPYYVKGAGLDFGDLNSFALHGGNSIRTWSTERGDQTAEALLDEAFDKGITVALGLTMGAEHWGFDYDDPEAVAAQLASLRDEVLKYRDHPALLVWIIGNELNFDYTNPKVYDAVNDVARMIHELDPNHPTTTTITGLGENVLRDIDARAPELDFVSFQIYGQLAELPDFIERTGFEQPFFVTEWGVIGHWEVEKTSWGAPIEATSSRKAEIYLNGYREKLEPLEGQMIGSYVFLWGQKQERTPTWYGLFTESGQETETVDVMHYIWNGEWPTKRAPIVDSVVLDGKSAGQSVELVAGQIYEAIINASDLDNDSLRFHWEVKPESEAQQVGGDFEESIQSIENLVNDSSASAIELRAPKEPGAYRLFVYIYDEQDHAAHANVPFLVTGGDDI